MSDELRDEKTYLAARAEQWLPGWRARASRARSSSSSSVTRCRSSREAPPLPRQAARVGRPCRAGRSTSRFRPSGSSLRDQRGDAMGLARRRGLRDPERALFRSQPYGDAPDRSRDLAPAGVRRWPEAPPGRRRCGRVLAARPQEAALEEADGVHRVRGQRARPLCRPAGNAGARDAVGARRGRRRGVVRRPALRGARARRTHQVGRRRAPGGSRSQRRLGGVDLGKVRRPSRSTRRSTTSCSPTR